MREARRTYRGTAGSATITAGSASPSGALVIEAKNISKSFGDRAIVSDFSLRVARGDRIGIVGPNGSGKTTLINMLIGASQPDSGTVKLGSTLEVATLNQHRDSLKPETTVAEALTGGGGDTVMVNGQPKHVIGYMRDFLFGPEQARTPLGKLSGGERGRLMLAQALAKPSNLLVLDEPTNDLDMETLDVLEDVIGDYPGTVILISHDRDFLDRLVSGVIVPEGDGRWTEYAGGYSDMLAQRGEDLKRAQAANETPKTDKAEKTAPAKATAPKQKMTFKHKHALETLPKTMATLEAKIKDLQAKLNDPKFFQRDRDGFDKVTNDLGEAQRKLTAAEEQWLELEMMREEMAGELRLEIVKPRRVRHQDLFQLLAAVAPTVEPVQRRAIIDGLGTAR